MKLNRRHGGTIGVVSAMILAVAVLSLVVLRPTSTVADPARQTQSDVDKLRSLTGQDFEIQFMSMMIVHHTSAIEMAQLAPDRATHQELKTLAQNVISSQTSEKEEFTGWLKAWYNIDASQPAPMPVGMPSTGGSDSTAFTFWLAVPLVLAGSILMGGLVLRRRS